MNKIIRIYTTNQCPFCSKAKKLLKFKGIQFEEINIADNEDIMIDELVKKSGIRTLPQIYSNDKFVGGCDDIYQLESQNKLDEALSC